MKYLFFLSFFFSSMAWAQVNQPVQQIGKLIYGNNHTEIILNKTEIHQYDMVMKKNTDYEFNVLQQGIDVIVKIFDPAGKEILSQDSPNGNEGPENIELNAAHSGKYRLQIIPFADSNAVPKGKYSLYARELTYEQSEKKKLLRAVLAEENKKTVLTLDIDHFWNAYDQLEKCKTTSDSIAAFQELYIDKATDGFKDFLMARNFTAAEYTRTIARYPRFYRSIRQNTYEVKKAAPYIEEIFSNFKKIYPGFTAFKVCFAIGTIRTGGTTSRKYVLIGTEITTSTKNNDLSEFNNNAMGKVLAGDTDIVQKIKNIVAHECVHTQQKDNLDKDAEKCDLLYACLMEGACDFIGELVAGNQINKVAQEYGNKNEAALWKAFNSELCNTSISNWLYNYSTAKDKPADLGYFIGYKIAQSYYNKQSDKQQAIVTILEMKNPKKLLEDSGYGLNFPTQ